MTLLERESEIAAIEAVLHRHGGVLLIEGGMGLGKTSLIEAGCARAEELGYDILRSRGSELEADFAFGVVRQLFERRLRGSAAEDRDALLAGPAVAVRPLLVGGIFESATPDRSFAVLHGLYWLASNVAASQPVLLVVDDAHWADEPSLRWLAYLAARVEGLPISVLAALRPGEVASTSASLAALRIEGTAVVCPALLSERAVSEVVRATIGDQASDEFCKAVWMATGGNPLYVTELLRTVKTDKRPLADVSPPVLLVGGRESIARRVVARVRGLGPSGLAFSQALAVLGDDCELRHAAALADMPITEATRLAAALVRLEVLASDRPPRFMHPVVHDALGASMESDRRDAAHRAAARLLHADGAPIGRVAAHLVGVDA